MITNNRLFHDGTNNIAYDRDIDTEKVQTHRHQQDEQPKKDDFPYVYFQFLEERGVTPHRVQLLCPSRERFVGLFAGLTTEETCGAFDLALTAKRFTTLLASGDGFESWMRGTRRADSTGHSALLPLNIE